MQRECFTCSVGQIRRRLLAVTVAVLLMMLMYVSVVDVVTKTFPLRRVLQKNIVITMLARVREDAISDRKQTISSTETLLRPINNNYLVVHGVVMISFIVIGLL